MNAFLLRRGRYWGADAVGWSMERLAHRGPAARILSSREMELHGWGDAPLASIRGALRLWSWGLGGAEHNRIVERFVRAGGPEFPSIDLIEGLVVVDDSRSGKLGVYLGWDCSIPVHYAQRRGSIYIAPEGKAFSDLPKRKRIQRLERGMALTTGPPHEGVTLTRIPWQWEPRPYTQLSYEACQQEVMRLLEEGIRDLKTKFPGPLPIALSGGLDSSISARLASQAGMECEAFTVWFDSGTGDAPPDLIGARLTAEACGIPLHELRIGPEDLEALARESVYMNETAYWRDIETGSYVLRLIRELRSRGHATLMTGLGGDGNFAGTVFRKQLGEHFQEAMVVSRRNRYMLGNLARTFGFRLISPFHYPPLGEFTLLLPHTYLVEETDGKLEGKRILRDMFRGTFASPLTTVPKDFPYRTSGSEALYAAVWGSRPDREALYRRWMEELLPLPSFRRRRRPRWGVPWKS